MKILKTIIELALLISIILFGVGYFKRDALPSKEEILNALYQEPLQEAVEMEPFEINKEGFTYTIYPKYSYQFHGLIVSQYDSENWLDIYHKKDPLNTKDICAVWGDNIKTGVYQETKFGHGEFTCYWRPRKEEGFPEGLTFFNSQASNSHLLPKNDEIYKKIKKADIGDQVYFKGYLVDYLIEFEGKQLARTTSTIREDTGNGACEVVYVADFQILKKSDSVYLAFYRYSKYSIALCFLFLVLLILLKPLASKTRIL